MRMYLLIRRISEYTASHILLGVFRTHEQAEAKATYAARYAIEPASDPRRDQAYREAGLSSRDLIVQEISGACVGRGGCGQQLFRGIWSGVA